MNTKIKRSIDLPVRVNPSFDERWNGEDKGLITCWEVGRKKRKGIPELATKAENGELPVLGWKGGTDIALKSNFKYGTFNYLAQWQGLRGEDLNIDLDQEVSLKCSKTNMLVTYTADSSKFSET